MLAIDPKSTTTVDISAVLNKAADLVETRGLTKHVQLSEDGCLCAVGAISMAIYGRCYDGGPLFYAAIDHAEKFLESTEEDFPPGYYLAFWNNLPERTQQQVVDALRGAAKVS